MDIPGRGRLTRRRHIVVAVVIGVLTISYVASFFFFRSWLNVTPHPVHPQTGELIAWYTFSRNATVNRVLFYYYYPMHHWVLGGYTASELEAIPIGQRSLEPGRAIYIDIGPDWIFSR